MKLNVTVDVPLTLDQLAGLFIELDDDSQAKFFVKASALMGSWTAGERYSQAFAIGRHLRDCECSTEEARDFVSAIAEAMRPAPTEAGRALDHFLDGRAMSEFEG